VIEKPNKYHPYGHFIRCTNCNGLLGYFMERPFAALTLAGTKFHKPAVLWCPDAGTAQEMVDYQCDCEKGSSNGEGESRPA